MADTQVFLPDLKEASGDDEAGETATVSFVYVEVDETVEKGQDLIEMVTDKATFNVPSPHTGVVKELKVEEDTEVRTGDLLCILDVPDA